MRIYFFKKKGSKISKETQKTEKKKWPQSRDFHNFIPLFLPPQFINGYTFSLIINPSSTIFFFTFLLISNLHQLQPNSIHLNSRPSQNHPFLCSFFILPIPFHPTTKTHPSSHFVILQWLQTPFGYSNISCHNQCFGCYFSFSVSWSQGLPIFLFFI